MNFFQQSPRTWLKKHLVTFFEICPVFRIPFTLRQLHWLICRMDVLSETDSQFHQSRPNGNVDTWKAQTRKRRSFKPSDALRCSSFVIEIRCATSKWISSICSASGILGLSSISPSTSTSTSLFGIKQRGKLHRSMSSSSSYTRP